jgi:type VI secretion system protein VasD
VPPTVVQIEFRAAANLNPNAMGEPAPLVVRVYELAAAGKFTDSDFFALFNQDLDALGADQLARDELRFVPGAERGLDKTLQPGTRFIGVMAAYRKIDEVRWRDVLPVTPQVVNRFAITLGENELSAARR